MIKGKMQRLGEGSGWGCMECEYKTAFQTNLFSHIETHHCSGVAYTCPQCFSAHPSKNSLRMHIRRKHNSPPKTGHIISYQSWLFSIKKIYLTVSQMDKYEQCITKRRREVGVAIPVATSREPNKIFIGTWRQNMSQLEDSLVLSVDNSVPVSTP